MILKLLGETGAQGIVTGDWFQLPGSRSPGSVQLEITGTATALIEATNLTEVAGDSITPVDIIAAATSTANGTVDASWGFIRARVTSHSSGSVHALVNVIAGN